MTIHRPITIDYETFYTKECSAKADPRNGWPGGAWHYTHHRNFYAYMVSFVDLETGEKGVIDDRNKLPGFVASLEGRTIIAHNAGFESAVSRSILPAFKPRNFFDTADLAAYLQSERNLLGATKHLLGRTISKELRDSMQGVHYNDLGVEQKQALRAYALTDSECTAQLFSTYQEKWPDFELWLSNFTLQQNEAGVYVDQPYLQEQIDKMNQTRSLAIRNIPWCETDEDTPLSAKKLAIWCREQNLVPPVSLAEDDEYCRAWEAEYGEQYPVIGHMRDFRKANTCLRKLHRIAISVRPDSTMPLELLYCGAPHTGRFSSRGVNIQNLPSDGKVCDLRGCFTPAPGNKFICSDLSGIEARCLPWLAGDFDYLKEVERLDRAAPDGETGDLYEPHAKRMFNFTGALKSDKDLRFATKVCVLSLGYQTGVKKFLSSLKLHVPDKIIERISQGDETLAQLSKRLVALYRGSNPKVQALWYSLDRDLRAACASEQPFHMQLPSGRVIHYWDLAMREAVDSMGRARAEVVGVKCRGEAPVRLYGGLLTENLCQAYARDVFVTAMQRLDRAGFTVKFSCHDEAVVEVSEDAASRDTCREIEHLMSTTPGWASGLPLASETSVKSRYAK